LSDGKNRRGVKYAAARYGREKSKLEFLFTKPQCENGLA
jgi:hypothetical protein